jgi:hypothetical protein
MNGRADPQDGSAHSFGVPSMSDSLEVQVLFTT